MGSIAQVSQAVNGLPKWAQVGGQMADDPLVARVRSMIEVGLQLNPDLDVEPLFFDMLTGNAVACEQPKDSDCKTNLDYAPVETVGEFWVMREAQREAAIFEDRARDWPTWINFLEEKRIDPFDDDDPEPEPDDAYEFLPGTTPWQEFTDQQRSTFVEDVARAKAKGKKWGESAPFLLVGMSALDSKGYVDARKAAFTAYHANFPDNIVSANPGGVMVRTTEFVKGKRKDVTKLLRWEQVDLAADYMNPAALRQMARECWKAGMYTKATDLLVTAFCVTLI